MNLSLRKPRTLENDLDDILAGRNSHYERVLVVAQPHSYFARAPREELVETFGSHARYLPESSFRLRFFFAMSVAAVSWVVSFLILTITFALLFRAGVALAIGPAILLSFGLGLTAFFRWWKVIIPYFDSLQPLWLVKRVTDRFTYKTEYQEIEDTETHQKYQIPVDVQITNEPLDRPAVVPIIPQTLLEEALTSTDSPTDRGIQRAEYLYLALNPIDIVEWFRSKGGGFSKADAVVGAGFILAMLLAIFLFVQAQSPTSVPPPPPGG